MIFCFNLNVLFIQTYPLEISEKFKICENLDVCLGQLEENSWLAVAVSRERAYNNHLISASQLYCFQDQEIIHSYALKLLVGKDFSHLNELNAFILSAKAGGLIEKWRSSNLFGSRFEDVKKVYHPLTLSTCFGMYLVWFLMIAITIFVFYLETYIHKKVLEPKPNRFWIIADKLIGPDRHFIKSNKLILKLRKIYQNNWKLITKWDFVRFCFLLIPRVSIAHKSNWNCPVAKIIECTQCACSQNPGNMSSNLILDSTVVLCVSFWINRIPKISKVEKLIYILNRINL